MWFVNHLYQKPTEKDCHLTVFLITCLMIYSQLELHLRYFLEYGSSSFAK